MDRISAVMLSVSVFVALALFGGAHLSLATPISLPSFGEVSMQFLSSPMPDRPWEVLIVARRLEPTDYGQLTMNGGTGEKVVWEGAVSAGDSIVQRTSFPPPPPGLYGIRATYISCPGCPDGINAATFVINVLVREDTVFWGGDIMSAELNYDIRKRGLSGVNPKHFDSLAPDLAERWRSVHQRMGITTIRRRGSEATQPPENRISTSEGRDTIAFPGSGPPPPRTTSDSVKALFPKRGPNPRQEPPPPPSVNPADTGFGRSAQAGGSQLCCENACVSQFREDAKLNLAASTSHSRTVRHQASNGRDYDRHPPNQTIPTHYRLCQSLTRTNRVCLFAHCGIVTRNIYDDVSCWNIATGHWY